MPLPSPPLYVRGEYVIETYVCGVQLLTIEKPINRPSWWNGEFASFQMLATGGEGGQTYVQRPTAPLTIRVRAFIHRVGGLQAETAQSSPTVIFKLLISGLSSIDLIVLGTVNLQFQGPFVPISFQSINSLNCGSSCPGCSPVAL